jgi:hypothetical protein
MLSYKCVIVRTRKKISYPSLATIELINNNNIGPFKLVTNELRSGDILLIQLENDKTKKIFKIDDEVNQIFGPPDIDEKCIQVFCNDYLKKVKIEKYIIEIYNNLYINELIIYKNDFEDFENEILKYFLITKEKNKIDYKKLRSICFKTLKNSKIADKVSLLLKYNSFDYFLNNKSKFIINFENLHVQK